MIHKTTVLIDDEPLARQLVKEYLGAFPGISVVAECGDGFEGFKAIREHRPDFVILDVQMPKINGFELLELLNDPPPVIFATAFDEFAVKAFDSNAVDYLLKPFSEDRFRQAVLKCLADPCESAAKATEVSTKVQPGKFHQQIVVRNQNEIAIIAVPEIFYLEAFDDYVKIFTGSTYYLKKKTLSFYEETLDPGIFFRTHRSYLINLKHLTRIEPLEKNTYIALLRDGRRVPLSRNGYLRLKVQLGL